jgi:hypothetical protein
MIMKEEDKATLVTQLPNFGEQELQTPDETYVPEGFETVEDYLQDMRETHALDLQADDDNRKAAVEDKKFTAGRQWDPFVEQQRKGLPCLTINTIPQFTAQLVGDWRTNRIAVKVIPSENGDKNTADIRSDLVRAIETSSRATRVYDNAFESMIQCGDGAFRVGVEYSNEDVFDQDIILKPIDDALSVVWDRMSIDPTGRDANHCFVDDVVPTKEYKATWKDADSSTLTDSERRALSSSGYRALEDDRTSSPSHHVRRR